MIDANESKEEQVWRMAREMTWDIYSVTSRGDFDHDHLVRNSLCRASSAIMANVAEGIEQESRFELGQAKDEIKELHQQLIKANKIAYIDHATLTRLEVFLKDLELVMIDLIASYNSFEFDTKTMRMNY